MNELPTTTFPLYAQDEIAVKYCYAMLESRLLGWRWYVLEFDGEDLCFGWVEGFEGEFGYFSLEELEECGVRLVENYPHGIPLDWVRSKSVA